MTAAELTLSSVPRISLLLLLSAAQLVPAAAASEWDRPSPGIAELGSRRYAAPPSSSPESGNSGGLRFGDFHGDAGKEDDSTPRPDRVICHLLIHFSVALEIIPAAAKRNKPRRSLVAALFVAPPRG